MSPPPPAFPAPTFFFPLSSLTGFLPFSLQSKLPFVWREKPRLTASLSLGNGPPPHRTRGIQYVALFLHFNTILPYPINARIFFSTLHLILPVGFLFFSSSHSSSLSFSLFSFFKSFSFPPVSLRPPLEFRFSFSDYFLHSTSWRPPEPFSYTYFFVQCVTRDGYSPFFAFHNRWRLFFPFFCGRFSWVLSFYLESFLFAWSLHISLPIGHDNPPSANKVFFLPSLSRIRT